VQYHPGARRAWRPAAAGLRVPARVMAPQLGLSLPERSGKEDSIQLDSPFFEF